VWKLSLSDQKSSRKEKKKIHKCVSIILRIKYLLVILLLFKYQSKIVNIQTKKN